MTSTPGLYKVPDLLSCDPFLPPDDDADGLPDPEADDQRGTPSPSLLFCDSRCSSSSVMWVAFTREQCDQMLDYSPNVSKNAKKFLHKKEVLQISPNCWQSFGLLLLKNCYREFSKIAQLVTMLVRLNQEESYVASYASCMNGPLR